MKTIFTRMLAAGIAMLLIVSMAACGTVNQEEDRTTVPETSAAGETAAQEPETEEETDDESITPEVISATALMFVDADGAKAKAVAIEYTRLIDAKSVDISDYDIQVYDVIEESSVELGSEPGKAVRAYVNNEMNVSETGGTEKGFYVIVEVNTDYQRSNVPKYNDAVRFSYQQVGEVNAINGDVCKAMEEAIVNYHSDEDEDKEESTVDAGGQAGDFGGFDAGFDGGLGGIKPGGFGGFGGPRKTYTIDDGTYRFMDVDRYELHSIEEGTAFAAKACFEEATGETVDMELPYALFIPENYAENPDGNYGMVLQIHDAGTMGTDPMLTITESQACANFASEEVQQMAADAGMDGLFVVAPMISNEYRSTRDNYTVSAAVGATWQLLDSLTEKYNINENRIFGTGQSMGGMQVIAMASQRDNYFAGIWEHGCQWGNNYNKEATYEGSSFYQTMDATINQKDDDGKDSDYGRNWYYLVSDDNLLISNCQGDNFSTTVWREFENLYLDIAGAEIPYVAFDPLGDSLDDQNAAVEKLTATENNGLGIYWYAYAGGSHMLTWVYGHKLDSGYKWLVNQTRESEQQREKLAELDNEWKAETDASLIAAKQTEDRQIGTYSDGTPAYFAVPAKGAGTRGYNSCWFGKTGSPEDAAHGPGWMAE